MWDADDEWSVGEARQVVDAFIRHCYPHELKLDEQKVNTYLETIVSTEGGDMSFRHWNKNYTHMLQHGRARIYENTTEIHSKRGAPDFPDTYRRAT